MANSFLQYRQAGAAAREMLIGAAAEAWGADPAALTIEDGVITGAGQEAPLAGFVAAAAEMEAPAEPRLKDASGFRLIGNAKVKRKDSLPKTNGTAMYAMDLDLPGQMVAEISGTAEDGVKIEKVTCAGEPGTPPSAPALANAIAQAGPRVTELPMAAHGVTFA